MCKNLYYHGKCTKEWRYYDNMYKHGITIVNLQKHDNMIVIGNFSMFFF